MSGSPVGSSVPAPVVDVVVPVFRSLGHVRGCLESVTTNTVVPHRLVVVDDASGPPTSAVLPELIDAHRRHHGEDAAVLLRNERNLGFLATANRGMRFGDSPYVVLLNSDARVAPGWIEGLRDALHAVPRAGLVTPLSNHAALTRLNVPWGTTYVEVARAVRRVSPRERPEIGIGSGFCLMAPRTLLAELDYFDEQYGRGYFEEADLCMRAQAAGYTTIADDATYVHHHGWASFGPTGRDEQMDANARRFKERWGDVHATRRRWYRTHRPYARLEARLRAELRGTAQTRPLRELPDSGARWTSEQARQEHIVLEAGTGDATHRRHDRRTWMSLAARAPQRPDDPSSPRILLLTSDFLPCPATNEVIAIGDQLLRLGARPTLATFGDVSLASFTAISTIRPHVLAGATELLTSVGPQDLVVVDTPALVYAALLLKQRDGSAVALRATPRPRASVTWSDEVAAETDALALVDAHLVEDDLAEGDLERPLGPARLHVSSGVDTDHYHPGTDREGEGVLLVHDERADPAARSHSREIARQLLAAGVEVSNYGDPCGVGGAHHVAYQTADAEAATLRAHAVLVEGTPAPGIDSLRRCAVACGTPVVAAAPLGTSDLKAGTHLRVAPRLDSDRHVALAREALEHTERNDALVSAGLELMRQRPLSTTAVALVDAACTLGGVPGADPQADRPASLPDRGLGEASARPTTQEEP